MGYRGGRRWAIRIRLAGHGSLYTSGTCPWCTRAKAYMVDNDIEFTEVDIINDLDGRREMVLMTGQYGVPVIRVGGKAIVGWNLEEFEQLYGM